MALNDPMQEQILARLAGMESYLAEIAGALTAIAKHQCPEFRSGERPASSAPQGAVGELTSIFAAPALSDARPFSRHEDDVFAKFLGSCDTSAQHPGDFTQAFGVPAATVEPEPPKSEAGEFTQMFGPRDIPSEPAAPEQSEYTRICGVPAVHTPGGRDPVGNGRGPER